MTQYDSDRRCERSRKSEGNEMIVHFYDIEYHRSGIIEGEYSQNFGWS